MKTVMLRRPQWKGSSVLLSLIAVLATIVLGGVWLKGNDHERSGAHREILEFEVLSGLDVLEQSNFEILHNKRVGLITNSTAVDRSGRRAVDIFANNPSIDLRVLFSPEHGLEARSEERIINDANDASTQRRIYSLFGQTDRPTPEMLADIDCLVFDIQDIGTRFYTYITTMGYAMEEAARHGLTFVVLDRPNPITGSIEGPLLDPERVSFTGYMPLPLRHGLTIGELARLFKKEKSLKLDLQVVKMKGWSRDLWFDETGIPWRNTSPNIRSLRAALLYPALGAFENTNLSVGRGTDTPFEIIGAPWLDENRVAMLLNKKRIPGITVIPRRLTPAQSTFAGLECGGIEFIVTNRILFQPLKLSLEIFSVLQENHKEWQAESFLDLFGNLELFNAIKGNSTPVEALYKQTQATLADFKTKAKKAQLYQ